MYKLLENIDSPKDLRKLKEKDLEPLCREIRDYMLDCLSKNPGHLGSSLGAVELIVGLHYVYNTPEDKIVFDVGHQAYAHKILTGRREAFRSMRTGGGISGFPKMSESPYDAFGAGHSSTSISAALGLAEAAKLSRSGSKAVALIGDGSLTGGLAWEGLNNAGSSKADILVILNDNNISIDNNTGAFHNYLLKITTSATYNKVKRHIWNVLGESKFRRWVQKKVIDAKSNLIRSSGGAVFEALGFRYFGPIDGNDIGEVTRTLKRLRSIPGPRILHCITRKGCGYGPAEADPTVWHAPGKFDRETGARVKTVGAPARYQDVFGQTLMDIAAIDDKVLGITPAMASGCGMTEFSKTYPDRFFDVGIEEEHAVTFAAGLAAGGYKPFVNIYSSFSQRSYDQIVHDVALQGLPVVLCLDRAGLVGEDGPTHTGAFDLSFLRSVPGAVISAPRNELELRNLMFSALGNTSGIYIRRYPRGAGEGVDWKDVSMSMIPTGRGECLREGRGVAVLTLGPVATAAVAAANRFKTSFHPGPAVFDLRFLKPLDSEILEKAGAFDAILTIEDGTLKGGLYGAVSEYFAGRENAPIIKCLGIPDEFIPQASRPQQLASCGLDEESIADMLSIMLNY